jgi:MFS family permease
MSDPSSSGTPRSPSPAELKSGWRFAVRALAHRNYRLFFAGQSLSLIGSWMTRVATGWLVYRMTGSAWLLGVVGFAGQIPAFFLAPFAGVWIDRWDRRRTLIVTQVLSMLESFVLAALALSGSITTAEIVLLNLFQGAVNAFDMPARQSFVVQMVGRREDLGSAIALNSSMVNGARLIGPSVAGLLIAVSNEGWCFAIDGVSYIAVILSLYAMRLAPASRPVHVRAVGRELREGWSYVWHSVPIRSVLALLALSGLVAMPFTVLMPIFARDVLHGGPHTLGLLLGAAGVGALMSAAVLAMRRSVLGLGRVIPASAALFGLGLLSFATSRSLPLSLLLLLGTGAGMMQLMAASNTILQTIVDEDKRGRVMSFYSMAFLGMTPFGSLIEGAAASRFGAPWTLFVCGLITIVGALWFVRRLPEVRRATRPIYERLGILPEVARGIGDASALLTPVEE